MPLRSENLSCAEKRDSLVAEEQLWRTGNVLFTYDKTVGVDLGDFVCTQEPSDMCCCGNHCQTQNNWSLSWGFGSHKRIYKILKDWQNNWSWLVYYFFKNQQIINLDIGDLVCLLKHQTNVWISSLAILQHTLTTIKRTMTELLSLATLNKCLMLRTIFSYNPMSIFSCNLSMYILQY